MSDNQRGILWAFAATALFTLAAALAKLASQEYHVLQILFLRQMVVFVTVMPTIARGFPASLHSDRPVLHLVRLTGAFVALVSGIWAVSILPLSTAISLGFTKVFFVSLLAMVVLKERVGPHRLGAVIAGFIGVLVVMRPGTEGFFQIKALVPVLGAAGAAVAVTSVRRLSQTESTTVLLAYLSVFVGILAGIPMIWLWKTPDLNGLVLLLGMGGVAAIGQRVGVHALRLAEASVVGMVDYMKIVHAAVLGFLLFAEIPDLYTIAGTAIIVAASAYVIHRERAQKAVLPPTLYG